MDVVAKWDNCICVVPGSQDDNYFELFGVSADEKSNAPDITTKLIRNRQWQTQLRRKANPYISHLVQKIRI